MLFLSCRTTWNVIEIGPWMTRQYSLITVSIERGVTEIFEYGLIDLGY